MLQILDFGGVGRTLHGAHDRGNFVGVVAARDASPERTPAFGRSQGRRPRGLTAPRRRGGGGRRGVRTAASTTASGDEVAHTEGNLHQRTKARLHRRRGRALEPRHRRHVRTRAVLALVERAGELGQEPVGGARPRALLHAREPVHPHVERRGAANPCARHHVVAHRRGDEGAARKLVAHHPAHDDVVLEVRVHGERPSDVHLNVVGEDHEAVAGVLVEHPVDLDLVAAGDDVAVVVGEADLGAVEGAGALGSACGVLEHRLGAQLERMRSFDAIGRREGPIVGKLLGLGRVEKPEQRRPGGELDAEFIESAEVLGRCAEADLVRVGVAGEKIVILAVTDHVPVAARERVVPARFAAVARFEGERSVTRTWL